MPRRGKLKRLLTFVPSLLAAMGRGKRQAAVQHYKLPDDDATEASSVCTPPPLRHVNYAFAAERVSRQTTYYTLPPEPKKRARSSSLPPAPPATVTSAADAEDRDEFDVDYLYHCLNVLEDDAAPRKRTVAWLPHITDYLAELLRLEGRAGFTHDRCHGCSGKLVTTSPGYRCDDCDDRALYCKTCTLANHARHPLHRVTVWTGQFFERVTLKSLGLRVQLGHAVGEMCCNRIPAFADSFVVLDTFGVHDVGVDFCGCESATSHTTQLLRLRWFPATARDPKTAATFRVMESFHLLAAQSKISAFDFYTSISRSSDNTGTNQPKDRYQSFLIMAREWRHLKMLKRGGRGNILGGAVAPPSGSCAVECPACPHPGKNLPDNYADSPPKQSWLYRLYLAIDANFRLKRKKVSNSEADPSLSAGCAYYVEQNGYHVHLATYDRDNPTDQREKLCNTHDAIKLANVKGAAGLAATGVATVDCSRHDMKRPCSVGDLQKGERQVNIDYILNSSLTQNAPPQTSISYDIACSYSVNAPARFLRYGYNSLRQRVTTWNIPMFHIQAHRERCRSVFSPYLLPLLGRLNGEGVERGWSQVNHAASATTQMGPGSREDTLNDIFGDQNHQKVTRMPALLLKRIKLAVPEREKHVAAYAEFTRALPRVDTEKWEAMVTTWEAAPTTAPNPYDLVRSHITQAALRVEMAQEDAADIQAGRAVSLHDDWSASTLVIVSMELEDHQRKMKADIKALGSHPTDLQQAKMLERRNVLQRKIDGWRSIQQLFTPGVASLVARPDNIDSTLEAQNIQLFLPSTACITSVVPAVLLKHEWRLREAQAYDALGDMRGHLEYKDQHIRGQREHGKTIDLIKSIEAKVALDTSRYRAAYAALMTLAGALGKVDWRGSLRPLNDDDIRHVSAGDGSGSVGRRELSWIWQTSGPLSTGTAVDPVVQENLQAALRVEWCKARARAQRWSEEVELLEEEMRRVIQYHEWRAGWWEQRVGTTFQDRPDYLEGANAYAYRQASIRRAMRDFCKRAWQFCLMFPKKTSTHSMSRTHA
ncbi:hypothetical protein OH76DRAFT_1459407 [Lentinus brumalis]|uniref:CxC2-like cysteine cluster KDZ transposase-associated domain-containing protein n=1 Tax=Lentinus brumalis TaxID=2498619 RepID=A0A371CKD3_9APHY|nr:hypothetical protein OH76DRAFT_1459407 [Polyporus brumalis]